MSNDLLLLSIEQNAQALPALRSNPPLSAVMASYEDGGTDPFDSLPAGLADYVRASCGSVGVVHTIPFSTGLHGRTYGFAVFADGSVPEAQRTAAFRAFLPLAHRMSGLMRDLPDRILERLGIRSSFGAPTDEWVWVLFHLAWHFPGHFARGVVWRARLLRGEKAPFVAPEEWLQLGGVSGTPQDCYPGLVFSRFPHELDLVTATGYAIELLSQAIRGGGTLQLTDAVRDQLLRLYQEFTAVGALFGRRTPGPLGMDLDARVLRLDTSFRTPAAAEWAGYQPGGAVQEDVYLARSGSAKEVCVLRGPAVNDFLRRADRAGALLPAWPAQPASLLLADAAAWLARVARRRELQSEQFYFVTEDQSPPHGQPIPPAQAAQHYWESTRLSPGWGGMVTDHRGNVERWVGFVLHMLKEHDPDSVEIRTVPEGGRAIGHGWNAILTLRETDLYRASARAMELAGWVPRPAAESQFSTTRRVCFQDPWETDEYPPPDAGRYVQYHNGDLSSSGEPEWRPGWAWAERPEDGWVECGMCGSGSARVLIAMGQPPAVCDWLPHDWPAAFFPLGGTAAHCAGWRELVRSVLGSQHDTIPPDDPRYGWRTLTRATRHLAHHLGVIPLERVVTRLPASRDEARLEVEPLLDGLVFARGRQNASSQRRPTSDGGGPATAPLHPTASNQPGSPAPTITDLASEVGRLQAEARANYADGQLGFTLVAVPSHLDAEGNGVKGQRCAEDSPDAGQLRDGVFYWPFRSFWNLGPVTAGDRGRFVLMAFDRDGTGTKTFREFSGRAGTALLSAAPPWAGIGCPGDASVTWAASIIFLSPSARTQVVERATGPRILSNPWAASIAALRDILSPPSPEPVTLPPPPLPPQRIRCDESDRSVSLDGKRVVGELELAVFRFFRAIADAYPNPISYRAIRARTPGLHGKHSTRDLKDRLPSPLSAWVQSGKHGYFLKLPAPK
jgi:hypothetical protein